jgi:2-polyprenyl-3-methyl-5-hydroxy-6-metoxy-1,4-benzoquinol methylase
MSHSLRDTNDWYKRVDPLAIVDPSLIKFIHANAGTKVLDLGCGPGGYSGSLNKLGHSCFALDINECYVEIASTLGVNAAVYDGRTIPLDDNSVDTVIAIEVLEHVADPAQLVREIARVTKTNFIASVPNCTKDFGAAPVVFDHMLDIDHKHFFTTNSLRELLTTQFAHVAIHQAMPVDEMLGDAIFPSYLARLYRGLLRLRLATPSRYFRLLANARL